MVGDKHLFQRLVHEAVEKCGHDLKCIEAFVEERQRTMSPEEKETLRHDIELVVGFHDPSSPFRTN